jgi:hypothetical protein
MLDWWVAQSWHPWTEHAIFALLFAVPLWAWLRHRGTAHAALLATAPPVIFFYARAEREVEDRLEALHGVPDEFAWVQCLIPVDWPWMQFMCFVAPLVVMAALFLLLTVQKRNGRSAQVSAL